MCILRKHKKKLMVIFVTVLLVGVVYSFFYLRININEQLDKGEIPLSIARNAESFLDSLSRKAAEDIVDITLNNTGYTKWNKYKGSLDVIVKRIDILPDKGKELVVAISLPPQEGIVAVYSREGGKMVYVSKIALLLPVTGISGVEVDFTDQELLVVNQYQDEMLGAFFNANYRDIFLMDKNRFDRVLGLVTDYNAYWNQTWEGMSKDAHWLWLRQRLQVQYADGGNTVKLTSDQALLKSAVSDSQTIPGDNDFIVRYKRVITQEYEWNSDWNSYILGEYVDKLTGEKVALLDSYWNSISGLINNKQCNLVKVINKKGEIKIIPVERLGHEREEVETCIR